MELVVNRKYLVLRGKGLGSKLLYQIGELFLEIGLKKILMTTFEVQAHIFCEKHGLQEQLSTR